MEQFDFDKVVERRGTDCVKWDTLPDDEVLPLWVADMDFEVAPCIRQAIAERAAHGVYGYTLRTEAYNEALINWFRDRHQWTIEKAWVLPTTGVIPALSCVLRALTLPGDKVLMHTPVYDCFYATLKNSGCEVLESPLSRVGDSYAIDFDAFERLCAEEHPALYLLCNPHNPAGRVWTREELTRISTICHRHHVCVVADEIHCEIVMPGHTYIPYATVSSEAQAESVILNSPSKAFNIAGLHTANIVCSDVRLRRQLQRAILQHQVGQANPFGPVALQAAYNEGADWLDALNAYLYDNYLALRTFFAEYLPKIEVLRLEGTYLVWADCTALEFTSDELADKLLHEAKVRVNSGTMYGKRTGQGYLRINIACPRKQLMDALTRIGRVLAPYMEDDFSLGCPM